MGQTTQYLHAMECAECLYQFDCDDRVEEAWIDCPNCDGSTLAKPV